MRVHGIPAFVSKTTFLLSYGSWAKPIWILNSFFPRSLRKSTFQFCLLMRWLRICCRRVTVNKCCAIWSFDYGMKTNTSSEHKHTFTHTPILHISQSLKQYLSLFVDFSLNCSVKCSGKYFETVLVCSWHTYLSKQYTCLKAIEPNQHLLNIWLDQFEIPYFNDEVGSAKFKI